jgi:hypothetical protein
MLGSSPQVAETKIFLASGFAVFYMHHRQWTAALKKIGRCSSVRVGPDNLRGLS